MDKPRTVLKRNSLFARLFTGVSHYGFVNGKKTYRIKHGVGDYIVQKREGGKWISFTVETNLAEARVRINAD